MTQTVRLLDFNNDTELRRAFGVLTHLRPNLDYPEFAQRVRTQNTEGYRIAFIERNSEIAAAAGFRVATFLAWGRVLYIDDLITHPEQTRSGLGGILMDWLIEEAVRQKCNEVHLDSGFTRYDAHRLYLKKGFRLSCHHLSLQNLLK